MTNGHRTDEDGASPAEDHRTYLPTPRHLYGGDGRLTEREKEELRLGGIARAHSPFADGSTATEMAMRPDYDMPRMPENFFG